MNNNRPLEFWKLIKMLAEKNIAEISNLSLHGGETPEWHQKEVANLSSLLKEQGENLPSRANTKDVSTF